MAATQGVVSGIGLSLFGVPNPVLWGVVAGFAALIPTLGTSLVLIPAALFLLTKGAFVAAIGLFIWALFAVGLIDNFLSPRLVGKGAQLHPLLVLLSVLGGISLFGPAGLILGPLCSSLLLALLSIYHQEKFFRKETHPLRTQQHKSNYYLNIFLLTQDAFQRLQRKNRKLFRALQAVFYK